MGHIRKFCCIVHNEFDVSPLEGETSTDELPKEVVEEEQSIRRGSNRAAAAAARTALKEAPANTKLRQGDPTATGGAQSSDS